MGLRGSRWIAVTSHTHRTHNSTHVADTNANCGFSVSWWDRLCGTYRAAPTGGQLGTERRLGEYHTPLFLGQLLLPFQGDAGSYPLASTRPVAT